jgi:chromosome segregation ATPase
MNKQDIDKAASALVGAKNYFAPVVTALNQADEVFSVLSNAIKLKDALEKDVDSLQSVLTGLKDQVLTTQAAISSNVKLTAEAKAQADKDIADAKAQADAEVKSIKAAVADRTKKTVADSEARIAQANAAAQQAEDAYAKEVNVMAAGKASLQADVDALEAKLASLREQAKKFAASLVE